MGSQLFRCKSIDQLLADSENPEKRLKKTLGWEASHSSLEEIIQSAWAWKQKHPHGYADDATAHV